MKPLWIPLALLATGHAAYAAQLPSAGSQLQQIPATPAQDRQAPKVDVQRDNTSAAPRSDGTKVLVNSLHVANAHAFSEADLVAASGFTPGHELTLAELRALAAKISGYYREHGYFLAQVIVPAQDIVKGTVTFSVVEGQYGKVVVRNESSLEDDVAKNLLAGLNTGDTVNIGPLESRLLQLSDLPGVAVKSTLVPGASAGASDLVVDIAPGDRITGSFDADNAGSRYSGQNRTGGTLNVNNPSGHGDVATLRALTSWDGLNYGRAAYQMQFGRADAGVAYTALSYDLGNEFESLDAHGTAQIASVYGRYPLLRSRSANLFVQFDFDAKKFHDRIDAASVIADKKANVGLLSLVGDSRDGLGGGGVNSYSLTWTSGKLDLQSAQALATDAATARSDGHYDKLNASFMRLQRLTNAVSLYAAVQGQVATQNLDVSEKMGLGGSTSVRAYPEGESYVDQGYVLNVEARVLLPAFTDRMPGSLQAVGFADTGTGRLSKDPWSAGENTRTLSGGGIGLNWLGASGFAVKAYYAHKIGAAAATSVPDSDSRIGVSAVKYF
ncbi:MAG: ShlB/FhaC/HecB family hemolysin secretion/activation protein [Gammaproteobacteria bacterium]